MQARSFQGIRVICKRTATLDNWIIWDLYEMMSLKHIISGGIPLRRSARNLFAAEQPVSKVAVGRRAEP
ncbi:hypothetical protein GGQ85_000645 [Nitrobacter vulgaris]|nr:hypothetical protein [Nitrobacter vulgaris]